MLTLTLVDAATLAMVPVLMVVVSVFERRWGPVVGGMVAAAPVTALVGLLLVSSHLDHATGVQMALSMSGHVPAQVGMAVVVIVIVRRWGLAGALAVGTAVFGALAWVSVLIPAPIAVLASIVTLGVALRVMRAPDPAHGADVATTPGDAGIIAVRAVVALVTAVGLLVISKQFGPAAGGALGSYPILTVTLCAFIIVSTGAVGVQRVLVGMVQGLPAYLTFVLVYALVATPLGPLVAGIVATVSCSTCYAVPLARARRNRRVPGTIDEARLADMGPGPEFPTAGVRAVPR